MRNEAAAGRRFAKWFRTICLAGSAAWLTGCSTSPIVRGYLPGDGLFYTVGSAQDEEYFAKNVTRAQSSYPFFSKQRVWEDAGAEPTPATRSMLREYYPLSVRWQLKDGRQFVAQNIDVAALMREYLAMHDFKMPWEREERLRTVGDFDPSLVYEVHEDEVLIKWLLRYNAVPPEERANALPKIELFQYLVATVKGTPATGIDFDKQVEVATK